MMMPSRDFLVRQAVLNSCYPGMATRSWLPVWAKQERLPGAFLARVQNEFRKLSARYEGVAQ